MVRTVLATTALITCSLLNVAMAASELSGDQIALAMAVDTAMFAAEKCPGFRIVEGSIFANVQAAGVSREQAMGPEWKQAMFLGDENAKDGYTKNPTSFCERVWKMLGSPDHPFVKHQLLERQ